MDHMLLLCGVSRALFPVFDLALCPLPDDRPSSVFNVGRRHHSSRSIDMRRRQRPGTASDVAVVRTPMPTGLRRALDQTGSRRRGRVSRTARACAGRVRRIRRCFPFTLAKPPPAGLIQGVFSSAHLTSTWTIFFFSFPFLFFLPRSMAYRCHGADSGAKVDRKSASQRAALTISCRINLEQDLSQVLKLIWLCHLDSYTLKLHT
jgi:hypothetical protein